MSGPDPITYIVVSYFPLLMGRPGESLDVEDTESIHALTNLLEELPSGGAHCCLWALKDGGPRPVLVMDDADAVYDHLMAWSEGDPVGWFSLTLMQKDGKYLVGLAPDIEKSIERFRVARQLRTGLPVPEDSKFSIMFRCLHFVSGSSNMFDVVKDELPDSMMVGFMDRSLLDLEDPESMDPDKIRWIGPFPRTRDGQMDDYFRELMDEATEPMDGPIVFDREGPSVP